MDWGGISAVLTDRSSRSLKKTVVGHGRSRAPAPESAGDLPRILFFNINGSGNGHLSRCLAYAPRFSLVTACVRLTPHNILAHRWLPATCAYLRLALGRPLPPWHPLISKDADSPHRAGISVRDYALSEHHVPESRYMDHIIILDE